MVIPSTHTVFFAQVTKICRFELLGGRFGCPEKGRLVVDGKERGDLLGAGVLGDSLGTLGDSVLGKLSGEEEPDSGLDLPRGDGGPLVVVCKTAGLSSNTLKQVVDKRVHDAHGLGGDTGVRVHLLQDLVDVDGIRLLPLLVLLLLIALGDSLGGLAGLGSSFSRGLGRHGELIFTGIFSLFNWRLRIRLRITHRFLSLIGRPAQGADPELEYK